MYQSVLVLWIWFTCPRKRDRGEKTKEMIFFIFVYCLLWLVGLHCICKLGQQEPPCRERTSLARRSCRVLHGEGKSYFRIFPLSKLKTFYFQPLWLKEHLCQMTWKKKEKGKLRRSKFFISLTFYQTDIPINTIISTTLIEEYIYPFILIGE